MIFAGIVFATLLDGGVRLLGRVLPIGRGWRLLIVVLLVLAFLLGTFYLTGAIFVFGVLGLVSRWGGFSLLKLLRYLKEELLITLGASSSDAALPSLMEKLEHLGCSKSVVGLVVPTGYIFNADGTCIYMTLAALFVAQDKLVMRERLSALGLPVPDWARLETPADLQAFLDE